MVRLSRWCFWLGMYALGFFGWKVFFEHGPGWEQMQAGAKMELARAWEAVRFWGYGKVGF